MCCNNKPHVWNGSSLGWNHASMRREWQSYKGLLLRPMRKVARFRGPQSNVMWSSRVFPLWKYFMTWSQFWQDYPKSHYNYLTFWTVTLGFHSIISLRFTPSVLYHVLSQTFISLSPVPHSSVRLSTTQPLFMRSVCSAGPGCSAVPAALAGEQTLIRAGEQRQTEEMLDLRREAS